MYKTENLLNAKQNFTKQSYLITVYSVFIKISLKSNLLLSSNLGKL